MSPVSDQAHPLARLYYAHDPMCSWCWAFNPCWQQIQQRLPRTVEVVRLVGGLAADSSEPMPLEMQTYLQQTWRQIQAQVPGSEFNYDFWRRCSPRRSTYPGCRAVIAARHQQAESAMTLAIQQAYYLHARNPSDESTLVALAQELGLDVSQFTRDLNAALTRQTLLSEIERCREMGAQGFPSLILEKQQQRWLLALDYSDPEAALSQIERCMEAPGCP
ncbi:MAG: DsbA family protein [Motiliproteus sp.]